MPRPKIYSQQVLVRLEPRLLALLKLKASQNRTSVVALVRYAVRRFLAEDPPRLGRQETLPLSEEMAAKDD